VSYSFHNHYTIKYLIPAEISVANDAKLKEDTSLVVEMLSPVKEKINGRNNYSE